MRPNYKFHAIALSGICAVITVMYLLLAPEPPPPVVENALQGDRYIQIYSATWGMECNPYIQQELDRRQKVPADKDESGKVVARPVITLVTTNNVLPTISGLCDGKLSCDISANSEFLASEPSKNCFKKLEIGYRCFSFDRLRSMTTEQDKTNRIDCEKDAPAPAPTENQVPQH